jgi:hypothetical protein
MVGHGVSAEHQAFADHGEVHEGAVAVAVPVLDYFGGSNAIPETMAKPSDNFMVINYGKIGKKQPAQKDNGNAGTQYDCPGERIAGHEIPKPLHRVRKQWHVGRSHSACGGRQITVIDYLGAIIKMCWKETTLLRFSNFNGSK